MSELAVKSSTWIRADQWECTQKQWTRTLLVLVHFKQVLDRKYNDTRLRLLLLCGGDVVDSFKRITPSGIIFGIPLILVQLYETLVSGRLKLNRILF